jgi:hypothetical protein
MRGRTENGRFHRHGIQLWRFANSASALALTNRVTTIDALQCDVTNLSREAQLSFDQTFTGEQVFLS